MIVKQVVDFIMSLANDEPAVKEKHYGSVYDLNNKDDAKYGYFNLTLSEANDEYDTDDDYTRFVFNMFFIDRLKRNNDNMLQIQDTAFETLRNIVKGIELEYDIDSCTYYPFVERFTDECAGMYCTITIIIPNYNCYDREI